MAFLSGGDYVSAVKRTQRTIPVTEFKARCLALLDEVQKTKATLVVTKRGKPVAKVVAVEAQTEGRSLRGSVRFLGDVVAPLDEPWDASKRVSSRRATRRRRR